MKKLMMAMTVAVTVVMAAGAAEYWTNSLERARKACNTGRFAGVGYVNPTELAAVDGILMTATNAVDVGPGCANDVVTGGVSKLPLSARRWLDGNGSNYVNYITHFRAWGFGDCERTPDMRLNMVDGFCHYGMGDSYIEDWKQRCVGEAARLVKKQIRKEGKSFVTKDGVNPVQVRLDAFTAALDAPRLAGLKEAAAGVGLNFTVDVDKIYPSTNEIAALKQKIMDGDLDLVPCRKGTLLICLGVEEYNRFVRAYNGEE